MLKSNLLLISALMLAGCASTTGIKTEIQKVEIPIAAPCKVTTPTKPDFNFDKLTTDSDIFTKSQALLADRLLHQGYETELLAALNSCTK